MSTLVFFGCSFSPSSFPQSQRLLLAEKTVWSRRWMGRLVPPPLLELLRRTIAQRGMETHPVMVLLDEGFDIQTQVLSSRFSVFRKLLQLALS